jgi:nucleotide-binding universal stress UspA family protein
MPASTGTESVERSHQPVRIGTVVVPLDGSDEATRAIPVAQQLAGVVHAVVESVIIAVPGDAVGELQRHVDDVNARFPGADAKVVRGEKPVDDLLSRVAAAPLGVVCMASHGRGRAAGFVGSTANAMITRAGGPIVVVGPEVPATHGFDQPVVACVDGHEPSEASIPVAMAWADALDVPFTVATVAEPVPEPIKPEAHYLRSHGPDIDADVYVNQVLDRWKSDKPAAPGRVIYDPVSVSAGLAVDLETRPASLVVLTTHARTGAARVLLGSVAASVVRHVPVPVVLVPLPH